MPAKDNKVISFFREELRAAHQLLEGTIEGVTHEQAHWAPPGIALPIGATYAHVVLSEDATMNGHAPRTSSPVCRLVDRENRGQRDPAHAQPQGPRFP